MSLPTAEEHIFQLRQEGWCVIPGIIPSAEVEAVRAGVEQTHGIAQQAYKAAGGHIGFQTFANGSPGINLIAYLPDLIPYLAHPRLVAVAGAVLDPHLRIAQTEFKFRQPNDLDANWRGYHSDWPHDLTDLDRAGTVAQPFSDVTMALSVLWMLTPFGPDNGGTWIVPRSHREVRNPRGWATQPHLDYGLDETAPIPGEIQAAGTAGSVLVIDSRIWHSPPGAIPSPEPRITIITRYVPWWLSLEFGGRNLAIVPRAVYEAMPDPVKQLYRHRAEGVDNPLRQPDPLKRPPAHRA